MTWLDVQQPKHIRHGTWLRVCLPVSNIYWAVVTGLMLAGCWQTVFSRPTPHCFYHCASVVIGNGSSECLFPVVAVHMLTLSSRLGFIPSCFIYGTVAIASLQNNPPVSGQ